MQKDLSLAKTLYQPIFMRKDNVILVFVVIQENCKSLAVYREPFEIS
jgi:hypothetical protein